MKSAHGLTWALGAIVEFSAPLPASSCSGVDLEGPEEGRLIQNVRLWEGDLPPHSKLVCPLTAILFSICPFSQKKDELCSHLIAETQERESSQSRHCTVCLERPFPTTVASQFRGTATGLGTCWDPLVIAEIPVFSEFYEKILEIMFLVWLMRASVC